MQISNVTTGFPVSASRQSPAAKADSLAQSALPADSYRSSCEPSTATARPQAAAHCADAPFQAIDAAFMERVASAGVAGYPAFTSSDHILDGQVLVTREKSGCTLTLHANEKGNARILESLRRQGVKAVDTERGPLYSATTPDGLEITYVPRTPGYEWEKPAEMCILTGDIPDEHRTLPPGTPPYALQGRVEVRLAAADDSPRALEEGLAGAGAFLGIGTAPAGRDEIELTYLRSLARLYRIEDDGAGLSCGEESARLKDALSLRLGVSDISALPSYSPAPVVGRAFRARAPEGSREVPCGWAHYEAPILDLHPELKEFHPFTYLRGGAPVKRIEALLDGDATLVSRLERERRHIPVHGMGTLDLYSGGANYIFCHLEKDVDAGVLVFKPTLLNRLDQIGHMTDEWGQATPQAEERRVTPGEYGGHYMYEIMVRNNLSLLDYLDRINVSTAQEKREIIDLFRRRGLTAVGGKPLRQLVQVKPPGQRLKEQVVRGFSFINTVMDSEPLNRAVQQFVHLSDKVIPGERPRGDGR